MYECINVLFVCLFVFYESSQKANKKANSERTKDNLDEAEGKGPDGFGGDRAANVGGEGADKGDGDSVVQHTLAKHKAVEEGLDVDLHENSHRGDGVCAREEGREDEALHKVGGADAEVGAELVEDQEVEDGREDRPDERDGQNAHNVLHKVALLEREPGVEDNRREEYLVEHLGERPRREKPPQPAKRFGELYVGEKKKKMFVCTCCDVM